MTALRTGFEFEAHVLRRSFGDLIALVTAPLMTLVFLAIIRHGGRDDLAPHAVLAPALIVLWGVALMVSGEIIAKDRETESLEAMVATPASFAGVLTGRIMAVTLVSLAGFVESWLAAFLVFRVAVPVPHPGAFVLIVVVTATAMTGTACVMSAVFVLARSARAFQNSLTYPFYVLGGVVVPIALLPGWLEPVSHMVFLSWSSDLLRDALSPAPIPDLAARLAVVLSLGTVAYLLGLALVRRTIDRLRRTGSLSYA